MTIEEKALKKVMIELKYTDEILDLVYKRDEYTTSDLQGVAQAIVMKIIEEAKGVL